jgi:hypothetical protein
MLRFCLERIFWEDENGQILSIETAVNIKIRGDPLIASKIEISWAEK